MLASRYCALLSVIALAMQARESLPSDLDSLRQIILLTADKHTKLLAVSKLLKRKPNDEPTLSVLEQMAREVVSYNGPAPEMYVNGQVVRDKVNPEFVRYAEQCGENDVPAYARRLSDEALILVLVNAQLPRTRALPIYLEGVNSQLLKVSAFSMVYTANTDSREEVYKVLDVYRPDPALASLLGSLAGMVVRKPTLRDDPRIMDYFRANGFLERYQILLQRYLAAPRK